MNARFVFLLSTLAVVLGLYLSNHISSNVLAQAPTPAPTPCPKSTANPRAEGLISSEGIIGKFDNPSGACVIDPKGGYAKFELPESYKALKRSYYEKAKASSTVEINEPVVPPVTLTVDLTRKNGIYNTTGDFTYDGTNIRRGTTTGVVFIDGNLTFTQDLTYNRNNAGIVFVIGGDVLIHKNVHGIDAVIISFGTICTNYDNTSSSCTGVDQNTSPDSVPLTVNGSLISLSESKPIVFGRIRVSNNEPAEIINQQPKYLVILRDLFSSSLEIRTEL